MPGRGLKIARLRSLARVGRLLIRWPRPAPGNSEEGGRRWCDEHESRRSYQAWTDKGGWKNLRPKRQGLLGTWDPLGAPMVGGVDTWGRRNTPTCSSCARSQERGTTQPHRRPPAIIRATARPRGRAPARKSKRLPSRPTRSIAKTNRKQPGRPWRIAPTKHTGAPRSR